MKIKWHPQLGVVAVVVSVNNVPIRLTEERGLHISKYHGELEPFQSEVLLTVMEPDALYVSPPGVRINYAAVREFSKL